MTWYGEETGTEESARVRVETTRVAKGRATELTWKSAMLIALVIVLLASLVSMAIAAVAPRGNPGSSAGVAAQPGSLAWNGSDQLNVLLLGFNSPSPDPGRLSAIMVWSYSPSTGRERLLSIPVSLWVTVPGFGQDTLANAYADGGPRLALLVTQSVTHLVIPYYLAFGRDALRQLVDTYSGVMVRDPGFVTMKNPTGSRHLTGDDALTYISAGKNDPASEVAQFPRLQRLFVALQLEALQPSSLFQVAATVNALGGTIDTNFPFSQVPALARRLSSLSPDHVTAGSLDFGTGAVANYTANGTRVLLPDWQRIHRLVRDLFGRQGIAGSVAVLNGSGQTGAAQGLASWFGQVGVRVTYYGSANSFGYSHTQVLMNGKVTASVSALARSVSTLLQAPIVTRAVRYSRAPVIVIIGADFQSPLQQ